MKKFLAMLLSLVLCCSFGLLAACDDSANDGTGSISGNYTEATDADYKAFMTAVSDEEKLFPGFDEEFGISADANANISATIGSGEQAINISAKISELSMALSVKSDTAGAEDDVAMNVSIDASAKVPEVPSMDIPAIDGVQENDNKIPIEDTTIKDELISFSEEDFEEYSELQNEIRKVYRTYPKECEERFALIKNLTAKAEKALAKYRAFYGLLNRLMIEDFLGEDDGTEHYLREYASYLDQIKTIQFFVLHLFSDLSSQKEIDINEDFNYNSVQISTVFYFEDNKSRQMYHIRNLTEYYFLLLHLFVENENRICHCQLCGRYFVPKTKKKTLYCDRVLKNGKTCKEFAPRLKHRILANRNEVLKAFDTQRCKMYKRYERTLNTPDTVEKPLSFEEYYDWLEKARTARDNYLEQKISKEEALNIIVSD